MSAVLMLLAAMQSAFPTPQAIAAMPTSQAAALLLDRSPPDLASHEVDSDAGFGFTGVSFIAVAKPLGDGVCWRKNYFVPASDIAKIGTGGPRPAPVTRNQIALADDCTSLKSSSFAWVQGGGVTVDTAAATLRRLSDLQQRVRKGKPLHAEIRCRRSTFTPDPCVAGGKAVLAKLPLDRTYIIESGEAPNAWELAVMPTGPGQLFYDVVLERYGNGRPTVTIRWEAPAPF